MSSNPIFSARARVAKDREYLATILFRNGSETTVACNKIENLNNGNTVIITGAYPELVYFNLSEICSISVIGHPEYKGES